MDLGEGCTTRIGSSRALTQVQAGAGTDHHRRRSELDRDLGGHNGRYPGSQRCEDYRLYQPGGRSRGGGDYYEGYSAADPDAYRPRYYSEPYDTSSQQQQQQQQQQQHQPYNASSSPPAASPSPDPGTSAWAAPSLGWHIECVEASLRLILSWGIGKNLKVVVE